MKTIGFIDYYLDEWHANTYPAMIKELSGGELEVAYAYGMIDSPLRGGMTTDQWCEKYSVARCVSIKELIKKSDYLLVLSPDICEMHEQLCQLPLRSGKRTYVDKTFAPDKETALRLFALADEYRTPCYSTSALRFAAEYKGIDPAEITAMNCWGPNDFNTYSIHQLEPLMMLMKAEPDQVMWLDGERWMTLAVQFRDGRSATVSCFGTGAPFVTNIGGKNKSRMVTVESDFFREFIKELCRFYQTGEIQVPHEDTISIMAVRGAGLRAQQTPGVWVKV